MLGNCKYRNISSCCHQKFLGGAPKFSILDCSLRPIHTTPFSNENGAKFIHFCLEFTFLGRELHTGNGPTFVQETVVHEKICTTFVRETSCFDGKFSLLSIFNLVDNSHDLSMTMFVPKTGNCDQLLFSECK